jgi:hypothetical protein
MEVLNIMVTKYSSIVKNLTMMKEIVMKVLEDKFNNPNTLTEESESDNKKDILSLMGSNLDDGYELCPDCHGSGSLQDNTCSSCNGKGII